MLKQSGTAITEYAIPIAIVGILLIVVTATLGNSLRIEIAQLLQGSRSDKTPGSITSRNFGVHPSLQTVRLTLSDGTQLTLQNFPTDPAALVETAGPNGTTDILADTVHELAQQLREAGKTDEANKMQALSNQGHRLAKIERVIENIKEKYGNNWEQYDTVKVPFEGQMLSVSELGVMITAGTVPDQSLPVSALSPAYKQLFGLQGKEADAYVGTELKNFILQYQSLSKRGALSDPAMSTIVNALTHDIAIISTRLGSTGAASNVYDLCVVYQDCREMQTYPTPNIYTANLTHSLSETSHYRSADICANGGGSDTGTHCPSGKR